MRQRLIQGFFLVVPLGAAHGFIIADGHSRSRPSTFLQSAVEPPKIILDDARATDSWIQRSIESQIKDQVVVGPDHVLIYDTTLRGM